MTVHDLNVIRDADGAIVGLDWERFVNERLVAHE
jgi:hypothetical protein